MSERMITIPFEEYNELQNFKSVAQKENMLVYIRQERYELGHGSHVWFIYTKDKAVRKITDELNEAMKELEKSREQCKQLEEENEKACYRIGWKSIVEMIVVLSILIGFAHLFKMYL